MIDACQRTDAGVEIDLPVRAHVFFSNIIPFVYIGTDKTALSLHVCGGGEELGHPDGVLVSVCERETRTQRERERERLLTERTLPAGESTILVCGCFALPAHTRLAVTT